MQDKYTIPKEKVRQLEALMKGQDVDAFLILSRENSDSILPFLTGEDVIDLGAAFFLKDGRHVMLASMADEGRFRASGVFEKMLSYDGSFSNLFKQEFDGISPTKLALNVSQSDPISDKLTYGLYLMLEELVGQEALERIEVSSKALIRELRCVKTDTEIQVLHQCIQMTNDIYDEVFAQVKCGMTEKQIGDLFIKGMKKRGVCNGLGQPFDYPIICLVRAGLAHRSPGDTEAIPGDILIIDFSVKFKGYISDIARSAYFLKPGETSAPDDIQHAFDTAVEAVSATIDVIGVGKRGWEVDAAGRKVVESKGYPTIRHAVGHPIGRDCHDSGTSLSPYRGDPNSPSNRKIGVNEIYAIEPTVIQDDGLPCFIVEENVVIRPHGPEILSRRQTELYLIKCEEDYHA